MGRVINLDFKQDVEFMSPNLESGIKNSISTFMGTDKFSDEVYDLMLNNDLQGALEKIVDFSVTCWEVKRITDSRWVYDLPKELTFSEITDISSVRKRDSNDIGYVRETCEALSRDELSIITIIPNAVDLYVDIFEEFGIDCVYNRHGMIYFSKDLCMQVKAILDCLPFVYKIDNFVEVKGDYAHASALSFRSKTLDYISSNIGYFLTQSILYEEAKDLRILSIDFEKLEDASQYIKNSSYSILLRSYDDEFRYLLVNKDTVEDITEDLKNHDIDVLSVSEYGYEE